MDTDRFEIHYFRTEVNTVHIGVTNTKFRSQAQAVGRVSSTLQRFTSDEIKIAFISFYSQGLRTVSYRVDLEKVTREQFNPVAADENNPGIKAVDLNNIQMKNSNQPLNWGVGPYIAHRPFNP